MAMEQITRLRRNASANSFVCNVYEASILASRVPLHSWGVFMITFEVHPEIDVRELRDRACFSTCSECHRRFHAKSEDQLSASLCQRYFDAMQSHRELVISVHVRPHPRCRPTL
jgi:hypothetical protein